MTQLHERPSDQSPQQLTLVEALPQREILNTYEYDYPRLGTSIRVEVVGPNDSRIYEAHEMEVAGMVDLGDPEQEVRDEFAPYMYSSRFFLAYDASPDGNSEELIGMGRIIPSNEMAGNKSLMDLASIPGWSKEGIPENEEETEHGPVTIHHETDVIAAFKAESGCTDLNKVWDIATLSLNLEKSPRERGLAADALIASFTQEVIDTWRKGDLTHVTSFNEQNAHEHFLNLGYPFHEMFGLEPMMYDSFESGEGMIAQPAWLSVEDLASTIVAAKTRHMGGLIVQPTMATLSSEIAS